MTTAANLCDCAEAWEYLHKSGLARHECPLCKAVLEKPRASLPRSKPSPRPLPTAPVAVQPARPVAPPWTPNPVADLALVARFSSALFGRAMEPCPTVVGLGGNGASPTALGGRGDHVDSAKHYPRAVDATRVLRALVRHRQGADAAILWMAYGVEQGGAQLGAAAHAVTHGFAPDPLRASWPRRIRGQCAALWGCEQVAMWWDGIAAVPREVGLCVAMGFAPADIRDAQRTRSTALRRADDEAGWGQRRLDAAGRVYLAAAETMTKRR